VLTLPSRVEYLGRLLASLEEVVGTVPAEVHVLYNHADGTPSASVQAELRRLAGGLPLRVEGARGSPTIAAGRNHLLAACRTPLICFLDDDVTLHGDVLPTLERALGAHPLALVGLRSLENDTDRAHKPRESTPYHEDGALRFMPVHGLLCAGYAATLRAVGGFNVRRRFWGEWTELNLRLWRLGLPTGYAMAGAHLRHWTSAPDSPTRNRPGRERDVLWGLICTALEYDAGAGTPGSDAFWDLVASRYLPYAFGADLAPARVLASVVELLPALATEWEDIARDRVAAARHPFHFHPFHRLDADDVRRVLRHAHRLLRRERARWRPPRHRADGRSRVLPARLRVTSPVPMRP
jgi:hypothetical protein